MTTATTHPIVDFVRARVEDADPSPALERAVLAVVDHELATWPTWPTDDAPEVTMTSYGDGEVHAYVRGERVDWESFAARYTRPGSPSRTLRLIAAAWSDHPDYRPDWRP